VTTYGFSEGDAKRIGRAVRLSERFPEKTSLGVTGSEGAAPGVRMMLGKMGSAAWSKNSSQTITIYAGNPGTNCAPTASAGTVAACNMFADISTSVSTARWVAVSNNGFGWYLLAAEC